MSLICLFGASGSGKSTVAKILREQYGYESVVAYTTRPRREGEIDGVDYHFVTPEKFLDMVGKGEFFEHRAYDTAYGVWSYGTTNESYKGPSKKIATFGYRCIPDLNEAPFRSETTLIRIEVPKEICAERIGLRPGEGSEEKRRRLEDDFLGAYAMTSVAQKKCQEKDHIWEWLKDIYIPWLVDYVIDGVKDSKEIKTPEEIVAEILSLPLKGSS